MSEDDDLENAQRLERELFEEMAEWSNQHHASMRLDNLDSQVNGYKANEERKAERDLFLKVRPYVTVEAENEIVDRDIDYRRRAAVSTQEMKDAKREGRKHDEARFLDRLDYDKRIYAMQVWRSVEEKSEVFRGKNHPATVNAREKAKEYSEPPKPTQKEAPGTHTNQFGNQTITSSTARRDIRLNKRLDKEAMNMDFSSPRQQQTAAPQTAPIPAPEPGLFKRGLNWLGFGKPSAEQVAKQTETPAQASKPIPQKTESHPAAARPAAATMSQPTTGRETPPSTSSTRTDAEKRVFRASMTSAPRSPEDALNKDHTRT